MSILKLQSSDNEIFDVDMDIAKCSVTIKNMLELLGHADEEEVIPLARVNSTILKKIIQWATYHKDDPPPLDESEDIPWNDEDEEEHIDNIHWDDENEEEPIDNIHWDDEDILYAQILIVNQFGFDGLLRLRVPELKKKKKKKTTRQTRTNNISFWDADFLKVDKSTLFELILAANYLEIKDLLDVTCKAVANLLNGKTVEEIHMILGVDFNLCCNN